MTPMLILLTGPAVGEVANPDTPEPILPGFTVRDYDSVCIKLIDCLTNDCDNYVWLEERIRALPGGEEWLVGLVLPGTVPYTRLPARLAILAPEPPPLLVERVRAWGGKEWYCEYYQELESDNDRCCILVGGENNGYGCYFPTWPEAVRAALGETHV